MKVVCEFFLVLLLVGIFSCASGQTGLLLHDDFNDNRHDWPVIETEVASTDIRSGQYFLQHKRSIKSLSVKKHVPINESKDYMIITEIIKYDMYKDPGFGIVWGRKNEDNEYNFIISSKGSFKIFRMDKGKIQIIVDWHPSKYIQKETSKNRLSIKKVGEEMMYFINHHQVAKTRLMPFYGDLVGVKVYHAQKVAVDFIRVYQR